MRNKRVKVCDDLVGPEEIEKVLNLRPRSGYPIIKRINDQLLKEGKIICPGKIPRDCFKKLVMERKRKGKRS